MGPGCAEGCGGGYAGASEEKGGGVRSANALGFLFLEDYLAGFWGWV